MTKRQVEKLEWLRSISDGTHLCLSCDHMYRQADRDRSWDIGGTTIDCNNCYMVFDDMYTRDLAGTFNGNNRKYSNGIETVDNGAGYWIVSCPYFISAEPINYNEYIKSDLWQKKRAERLKHDNYQCVRCGTAKNLNVHHITYDRLGHEDIADLVTLCKKCHNYVHKND